MTQEIAAIMVLTVGALALSGALWGWRRRGKKYEPWATLLRFDVPTSESLGVLDALYVGTTETGSPLERVALGPLKYRARATIVLHPEGLVLTSRGSAPLLLPGPKGLSAGVATWTIDRVVEPDGLLMVRWLLGTHQVESYFRLVDSNIQGSVAAINTLFQETA
jgi:hypothetical protein